MMANPNTGDKSVLTRLIREKQENERRFDLKVQALGQSLERIKSHYGGATGNSEQIIFAAPE